MSDGKSPFLNSEAFEELRASVRHRARNDQCGILTYFDKWLLDQPASWKGTKSDEWDDRQWIEEFACRAAQGRFVRFAERATESAAAVQRTAEATSDIPDRIMMMSQGTRGPVRWRGLPLFKCAFDLALYTHLLDEMRPGSIFEIGSGSGASALWLADMCNSLGTPCPVVSLDRRPPIVAHPNVTFIAGDSAAVAECIPASMLTAARRPMLVVEDAHESVGEVLRHFATHMQSGDRIVVEDSAAKQDVLCDFAAWASDMFLVDTFYTDFFGHNATSAVNSFLVRS